MMNYYIVTEEVFNTLTKDNISFMRRSLDYTKRLISTTDNVENIITKFNNVTLCSDYTFDNHTDWVGDNTGFEVQEIQDGGYIEELDK